MGRCLRTSYPKNQMTYCIAEYTWGRLFFVLFCFLSFGTEFTTFVVDGGVLKVDYLRAKQLAETPYDNSQGRRVDEYFYDCLGPEKYGNTNRTYQVTALMKRKSESTLIQMFGGYRPANMEIVTERTKSQPWTITNHPSSTAAEKEQVPRFIFNTSPVDKILLLS